MAEFRNSAHNYESGESLAVMQSNVSKQQRDDLEKQVVAGLKNEINEKSDAKSYPKEYLNNIVEALSDREVLGKVFAVNGIKLSDFSTVKDYVKRVQAVVGAKQDGLFGNATKRAVKSYSEALAIGEGEVDTVGALARSDRELIDEYRKVNHLVEDNRIIKIEQDALLVNVISGFSTDMLDKSQGAYNVVEEQQFLERYLDSKYKDLISKNVGSKVYLPRNTFVTFDYASNKLTLLKEKNAKLVELSPKDLLLVERFKFVDSQTPTVEVKDESGKPKKKIDFGDLDTPDNSWLDNIDPLIDAKEGGDKNEQASR